MEREKLIKYYERQLEKVKQSYSRTTGTLHAEEYMAQRVAGYIAQIEKDLEEVRNGRNW